MVQYVPCTTQLSLGAFPILAIKKCLICKKSTFTYLFIQYFSQKRQLRIAILCPTPLKSKAERGNILAKPSFEEVTQCHRTQMLHLPLIYKALILNSKTMLTLNISYDLLKLSIRLLQICSLLFHLLSGSYTSKIALAKKEHKIFPLIITNTGSFNQWNYSHMFFMILSYRNCQIVWNPHISIFLAR